MDFLKNKNKIFTGITIGMVVVIAILVIAIYNQNTVKLTTDSVTHEAGHELTLNAMDLFDVDEEKAAQITFDISGVDVNTVGEYTAVASFNNKKFDIKVNVVDTTAPMVEFKQRMVFTNDFENTDYEETFEGIYDASEYTVKFVRFEHKGNLELMTESVIKGYTDTIPVPCDAEKMQTIGTTDIPTEEGVYRAVMEVADVQGNAVYEEVYVVYDTTGAMIEDYPDSVVYVAEEDIDKEPTIDVGQYTITDNVDGALSDEQISYELELKDETNHEWLVHVTARDRAGNGSKADFLVTVKVGDGTTTENNGGASNQGGTNNSTTGNGGNSSTGGGTTDNNQSYDPADKDKDGVVTGDEASAYIHPSEQAVIDAGYGVVVKIDSATYSVLTHGDGYANGKYGSDILREYLESQGLYANGGISGCWIDSEKDLYRFIAEDIISIPEDSGNDW